MTRQQSGRGTAAPRPWDVAQTKTKTSPSPPRGLFTRRERTKKLNEHVQRTHKAFTISVLKVGQRGPVRIPQPVLGPHRWTYWAPVKRADCSQRASARCFMWQVEVWLEAGGRRPDRSPRDGRAEETPAKQGFIKHAVTYLSKHFLLIPEKKSPSLSTQFYFILSNVKWNWPKNLKTKPNMKQTQGHFHSQCR